MREEREEMNYETKTEVERIVEDIQNATVTVENYKRYVEKINNTERIIMAQLENFSSAHRNLKRKMNDLLKSERVVESQRQGYVTKDVFELQNDLNLLYKDIYSWKSLSAKMNKLLFGKISIVLEDINALDIKKGALEEIREMETKRQESQLAEINRIVSMTEEIVNHKLSMLDEKIMNTIRLIEQEARIEKQTMINMFIEAIKMSQKDKKQLVEILKNSNVDLDIAYTKIKEQLKVPVGKITPTVYKDVEEEADEEEDDNPFVVNDEEDEDDKL